MSVMRSANQPTRFGALALLIAAAIGGGGLAAPAPTGQAQSSPPGRFAPLVPLTGVGTAPGLTGPKAPGSPAGGSQFTPTGVPPEVARLGHTILPAASPAFFPVDGPFNWGQQGAQFGASRSGRAHEGQDMMARAGTPLLAVRDGLVIESGDGGGRGNYVAIYDAPAQRTYVYLHLLRPAAAHAGQTVRGGQLLGEVGCTGSCFGDHLHFEMRRGRSVDGAAIDPRPDLQRWLQSSDAQATLPPGAH
jgi:murein DD-endopeptidase MepM/ murein hydrolase activator NlpD